MCARYLLLAVIVFLGVFDHGSCELTIISRAEWGADRPRVRNDLIIVYPVIFVTISHSLTETCTTREQCERLIRGIQFMHMRQIGWNDVANNFLIGGDGNVYEGRGWEYQSGTSKNYNKKSLNISFMGDFSNVQAPQVMFDALKNLLALGVRLGHIEPDYELFGIGQIEFTSSPGKIKEEIMTWDHYVRQPRF